MRIFTQKKDPATTLQAPCNQVVGTLQPYNHPETTGYALKWGVWACQNRFSTPNCPNSVRYFEKTVKNGGFARVG